MKITREWCMPDHNTFAMPPVRTLLERYLLQGMVVVDPFARNATWGTITNDLNPDTAAQHHLPAEQFCEGLLDRGEFADAVLFDPPYSPRQISECYQAAGLKAGMKETQNGSLYKGVRSRLATVLKPHGLAISFGWNSAEFGKDFSIVEIVLLAHGGAHNDTICAVHRKSGQQDLFA